MPNSFFAFPFFLLQFDNPSFNPENVVYTPRLIVLSGPTGVGKTALSIALAKHLDCPIISADSRQLYKEIPIGTAAPTPQEQSLCLHYMVSNKSILEPYSAGQFENDVLQLLQELFSKHPFVVLCGGSMLYIDAVCRGIDNIPDADPEIRKTLNERYAREGLSGILTELKLADPEYYHLVDHKNPQRVIHGLEIFLSCGTPLSYFRTGVEKKRFFKIHRFQLVRNREDLYERINLRVIQMIQEGLEEEAKALFPYRHLNALNTVGYKEMFAYLENKIDLSEAIRLIQRNSRHYARKQMTWFRKDGRYKEIDASLTPEKQIAAIADSIKKVAPISEISSPIKPATFGH